MRFRHLSPAERGLFWAVICFTIACNAVALIVGYSLVLHLVQGIGGIDPKMAKLFPALGDATLLIAEGGLIFLWMMRRRVTDPTVINRGPVIAVMLIAAATMLGAVELQAGHSWERRLLFASAPLLAFGLFNVTLVVVKAMLLAVGHIGTETTATWGEAEIADELASGSVPPQKVEGNGNDATARAQIEARLAILSPVALRGLKARELYQALRADGVVVSEAYVGRILGEWKAVRPDKSLRRS